MTEQEAREILLQYMLNQVDEDFPLAWVSDVKEEGEEDFLFDANIYKEGEDPRKESWSYRVDKNTKEVFLQVKWGCPEYHRKLIESMRGKITKWAEK